MSVLLKQKVANEFIECRCVVRNSDFADSGYFGAFVVNQSVPRRSQSA
jgi:hypothetical protein